nr:uncharacterized protein LOC111508467 isoform X1 [Leptinotarsa decemlineata]
MTLYHLIHTGVSVIVSLGFFVFFSILSNKFGIYNGSLAASYNRSLWPNSWIVSGIQVVQWERHFEGTVTADAFSFMVVYFYRSGLIEREDMHSNPSNSIKSLSVYGYLMIALNLVQFIFFLTIQLRYQPAIFPVSTSNFFNLLICILGLKSGIFLVYYCLRYKPRSEEEQALLGGNNN